MNCLIRCLFGKLSSFIFYKLSFILQKKKKKLLKQFQSSYSEPSLSAVFEMQSLFRASFFFLLQVQTLLIFLYCVFGSFGAISMVTCLQGQSKAEKLWLGSSFVTALILCWHLSLDRSLNNSHTFMQVKLEQNYVDIEL